MFVDASALVAILSEEPGGVDLSERLSRADKPITSPIAIFEAVAALTRKSRLPVEIVGKGVRNFCEEAAIEIVAVVPEAATDALRAFAQYGKGTGHPAQLNLGDCFAYAMAKRNGLPLLYKGDDFSRTDLA